MTYGGTEKLLSDWGICSDFSDGVANKQRRTITFRTIERFDRGGSPQFAFDDAIVIWRDRTAIGVGGTIWFQGLLDDPIQHTGGGEEYVEYRAHNVWWLFERQAFKQTRNQFTGWDSSHQSLSTANPHGSSGSGVNYRSGDVLTSNGGTGTACTVMVTNVDGAGKILGVRVAGVGKFSAAPGSPNSMTGGHGTGASIDLNFSNSPILLPSVLPEVYLGESPDETFQTNGAQVLEVINWVNEVYNPTKRGATSGRDNSQDVVQAGTIDPKAFFPVSRVNTMFCSDTIREVLRWSCDSIIVVDETTTPPTLHVRTLSKWNYATTPPTFVDYTNLPEVAITITASQESRITLQSQQSLQLPGVMIYYKTFAQIAGVYTPAVIVDKYPSDITDWTPEVLSCSVDIPGCIATYVNATVKTYPMPDPSTGDWVTWFTRHVAQFRSSRVDGTSIALVAGSLTIKDVTGASVSLATFPNELSAVFESSGAPSKQLPDWVGASSVRATVSAKFSYTYYKDDDHHVKELVHKDREFHQDVVLTNAASGPYQRCSFFDTGGAIPQGCAEAVYRSTNAQQYAGSITFVGAQARADIKLGTQLKLIGPTTTFTNLLVQAVRSSPHLGRIEVDFGPTAPMDPYLWQGLAMATRYRKIYQMPSGRAAGGMPGGGGQFDSSNGLPENNTADGGNGKAAGFFYDPK